MRELRLNVGLDVVNQRLVGVLRAGVHRLGDYGIGGVASGVYGTNVIFLVPAVHAVAEFQRRFESDKVFITIKPLNLADIANSRTIVVLLGHFHPLPYLEFSHRNLLCLGFLWIAVAVNLTATSPSPHTQ